tara:strand:+ start:1446 stop:2261 length:816 start_codon:yes stop_codon:yes gene_type:complete
MEQKAPRLSSASLVLGCLLVAFTIINSTVNLAFENGLSIEEFIALGVAMPAFLISYFASRERSIPELVSQLSIQEQYDALESTPTPFRRSSSPTQQAGSEQLGSPQPSGLQMQTDRASVLDVTPAQPQTMQTSVEVSNALDSLTSGEFGATAAAMASKNPAPHTATAQNRPFTQSVGSMASSHQRTPIDNVPLPSGSLAENPPPEVVHTSAVPSMPDLSDLLNDSTSPLESPPKPASPNAQNAPSLPSLPALPEMPTTASTPDLPNLDDLF